jgi:twitching motility two-component system response regulator PilG
MNSFNVPPRIPGAAHTRPLRDIQYDLEHIEGKLVLVIDDSPMICRIVEFSLREYGINAISFYSGVDALTALQEGVIPVPDLVLLDIKLPVMSGYNIAGMLTNNRTFRRNGRPVPIVMLSSKDGIFDRLRAKRAGAEDFISKPFEKPDLIRKVFAFLDLELPEEISTGKN